MKLTNLFAAAVIAASANTATAQDAADWAGFYAGITASSIGQQTNRGVPGYSFGGIGGTGPGIMLGYNHAVSPNFIVGGELTYSFGKTYNADFFGLSLEEEASLRLRGGYVMGNTLVYGAIGYAQANAVYLFSFTDKGDGAVVAVGLEHMLNPNMTIRVEYSHAEYSGYDFLPGIWEDTTDTLTVGVAYKF